MSEALRTPDERFVDLPGFSYNPVYIDDLKGFEGLRMHYPDILYRNGVKILPKKRCRPLTNRGAL
jgi:hypothetical protein